MVIIQFFHPFPQPDKQQNIFVAFISSRLLNTCISLNFMLPAVLSQLRLQPVKYIELMHIKEILFGKILMFILESVPSDFPTLQQYQGEGRTPNVELHFCLVVCRLTLCALV